MSVGGKERHTAVAGEVPVTSAGDRLIRQLDFSWINRLSCLDLPLRSYSAPTTLSLADHPLF